MYTVSYCIFTRERVVHSFSYTIDDFLAFSLLFETGEGGLIWFFQRRWRIALGVEAEVNKSSNSSNFLDYFHRLGRAIKTADSRCGSSVDNLDEIDLVWKDGEGIRHDFCSMRRKELDQRSQGSVVCL